MNNSIKDKNLKEVKIQLKRAEVQKKILIKNIYKEYEIYLEAVRNSIFSSTEKGIFGLYSDLSQCDSDKSLNIVELTNFINQNISFLINSKLPLLTIEQLKLGDIIDSQKQLLNPKGFKDIVNFNVYNSVDFNYQNELSTKESFEFDCNNSSNAYEYYELFNEDEFISLNLDDNIYFNSISAENSIENIEPEKHIVDSVFAILEETKPNKLIHHENLNDPQNLNHQVNQVSLSSDDLNIFETIDKAFSQFLFDLSFEINSELYKINFIKNFIAEETFKCLSNKNLVKHPYPFVIRFGLNSNNLSEYNSKYFDISFFSISNVELEFYNLDLSICRNSINELKNKFRLLSKKQKYWKNREFSLNSFN